MKIQSNLYQNNPGYDNNRTMISNKPSLYVQAKYPAGQSRLPT